MRLNFFLFFSYSFRTYFLVSLWEFQARNFSYLRHWDQYVSKIAQRWNDEVRV